MLKREELLIEAEELATRLDDPNLRLFDASVLLVQGDETAREKYLKQHIPGAAFLDHAAVSDPSKQAMFMVPDESTLANSIGDLGIANDNEVVVYSSDQVMWATRIWWLLRYAGHHRVRVLNGGLSDWTGELESGENTYQPATFHSQFSPDMFADKDEVQAAIGHSGVCTINALPYSFYTGEADIAYARQGHITGSVSQPFDNMMEGNKIKATAQLTALFSDRASDERLITYCGGGIAATLNACAARLAGLNNVAVYDGSMSEWLAEGLPTTQGSEPG